MASKTMVDALIEIGGELISRLIAKKFPLEAAWWAQIVGEEDRILYLASRVVDEKGPAFAYPVVQETLGEMDQTLLLSRIKVTGVKDQMTQDVIKLQTHHPDVYPFYIGRIRIGPYMVEEFYAYPFPVRNSSQLHVRLRTEIEQYMESDYTDQERFAKHQILTSGVNPVQADYWIQMKRRERPLPSIPAGTEGSARIVAWSDEPDPLLMITTPDGRRGLTRKSNVEIVNP
jgi:hypothetical protein